MSLEFRNINSNFATSEDTPISDRFVVSGDAIENLIFSVSPDNGAIFGELDLNPDGTFTYTPNKDSNFDEFVQIVISDGVESITRFVTIEVTPVNDAPEISQTEFEVIGSRTQSFSFFLRDPEFDERFVEIASDSAPQNGSATVSFETIGLLTYTPNPGFFGEDEVRLLISDDQGAERVETLSILVSDVNQLLGQLEFEFSVRAGEAITDTLVPDDIDGENLTFTFDPTFSPLDGDVVVTSDGTFTFTANQDARSVDSFAFSVTDGQRTELGFVDITYLPSQVGTLGPDLVTLSDDDDVFDALGGADQIAGFRGNDMITGRGGSDILDGGAGADTLFGNGGSDLLEGGLGKDELFGGGGKDTLEGNGGKDLLNAGGGRDFLNGGGGRDILDGQGGRDVLNGGGGRDSIFGGRGSDTLTGDGGNDRFIFGLGNGRDTITDFQQGRDKIVIEGGADSFESLNITQVGTDVRIQIANTRVTVENDLVENFTQNDFIF